MTDDLIPVPCECQHGTVQCWKAIGGGISQSAAGENTEPDLNLIEPTIMLRREDETDLGWRPSQARAAAPVLVLMLSLTIEASSTIELSLVIEEGQRTGCFGPASSTPRRVPSSR